MPRQRCQHNLRQGCRTCHPGDFCSHNVRKNQCPTCRPSGWFCQHGTRRSYCKECKGKGVCEHGNRKTRCPECPRASEFCEHLKWKAVCHQCNMQGVISARLRERARIVTGSGIGFLTDLGCTVNELMQHLESQFKPEMTWENYGKTNDKWQIDHVLPLRPHRKKLPDDDLRKRLHYTNIQPLWFMENMTKHNTEPTLTFPPSY